MDRDDDDDFSIESVWAEYADSIRASEFEVGPRTLLRCTFYAGAIAVLTTLRKYANDERSSDLDGAALVRGWEKEAAAYFNGLSEADRILFADKPDDTAKP